MYSPNTYSYNYENNEVKLSEISENTYENLNNPNNIETTIMNVVKNNIYTELSEMDKGNNIRVVWKGADYTYGTEENQILKKPFIINLYDKEYNLLDSYELENNGIASYSWFISDNKIYFQTNHPSYRKSEEICWFLKLYIFDLRSNYFL